MERITPATPKHRLDNDTRDSIETVFVPQNNLVLVIKNNNVRNVHFDCARHEYVLMSVLLKELKKMVVNTLNFVFLVK